MNKKQTAKQRLGILICGHHVEEMIEEYGEYNQAFMRLLGPDRYDYQSYFPVDDQFPESADAADAWLITGSKHGVYEDFAWIAPLENLVREIYAKQLPMIGVCFGHQLMAQALGGRVEKFSGGWTVGTKPYRFKDESALSNKNDEQLMLNAWHQDQVVEQPAGTRIIASSPGCKIAGLEYRNNTVSIQPHPEFGAGQLQSLLDHRGETLPKEVRQSASGSIAKDLANQRIADWFNQKLSSSTNKYS